MYNNAGSHNVAATGSAGLGRFEISWSEPCVREVPAARDRLGRSPPSGGGPAEEKQARRDASVRHSETPELAQDCASDVLSHHNNLGPAPYRTMSAFEAVRLGRGRPGRVESGQSLKAKRTAAFRPRTLQTCHSDSGQSLLAERGCEERFRVELGCRGRPANLDRTIGSAAIGIPLREVSCQDAVLSFSTSLRVPRPRRPVSTLIVRRCARAGSPVH